MKYIKWFVNSWLVGRTTDQPSPGSKNVFIAIAAVALCLTFPSVGRGSPLPGAIFTTDTGGAVDLNIYASKDDVYLNGGPAHPGAAGLPDGSYYVMVTEPNGTLLGMSLTPVVTVSGGEFVQVYQLSSIVLTASSGFTAAGYDDTTNAGGEYKAWIGTDSTFSKTKTDNFKVKSNGGGGGGEPTTAILHIVKFYDTNADGTKQPSEPAIEGWVFHVSDDIHLDRETPITLVLAAPGTYTVTELSPLETNWVHTTEDVMQIDLAPGDEEYLEFGNVALGRRGGLTLGYWSNKNGQKNTTSADLQFLSSLHLRNASGSDFDPASTGKLSSWLLSASATNMAYMLSAQLAAMELNTRHSNISGVQGSFLLYRPELNVYGITFNSGFISIDDLMTAADAALAAHPITVTAGPDRTYQEALKNALDDANNNKPFYVLPPNPLPTFTF